MFNFLKRRDKEELQECDYTKAYKYFVKTKDGYVQKRNYCLFRTSLL